MYHKQNYKITRMEINQSVQGETLEQKVERMVSNSEPITDGAPIIYTDRKDGVLPAYNVRTDKQELALDAIDRVTRSRMLKSLENGKNKDGEANSADTTNTELTN